MKLYLTSGKLLGQSPHNGHEMDTTIIRQLLLAQFHQIFTQIGRMHVTAFQHNCTNLHTVAISLLSPIFAKGFIEFLRKKIISCSVGEY